MAGAPARKPVSPASIAGVSGGLSETRHILLIGHSAELASALSAALLETGRDEFDSKTVNNLSEALSTAARSPVEAILVNLALPDSAGLGTVVQLVKALPHIPVLVVGRDVGKGVFRDVLKAGAQDYLIESQLNPYTLGRALNGAIGRKAAEDLLYIERERAQVTLNSIGDGVISTDVNSIVTYLNAVAEDLTGWKLAEAAGAPLIDVLHLIDGSSRQRITDPSQMAIGANRTVALSNNCVLVRRDGTEKPIEDSIAPIHDREHRVTGSVVVFHDVSESRGMIRRMSHLAQHDFLTDLPNRMLLNDRLCQAIELAQRHKQKLAVLFVDLDQFKYINDSLGHNIGDELLKVLGLRLLACVRGSDTVSRLGGDEFVVLLPEIDRVESAAFLAEKMRVTISAPHAIAGHELHLTASIGISVYPADGIDADTLIRNADTAMYHAKAHGRDSVAFFRPDMNVRAVERQSVEEDLRRALEHGEFILEYQPRVDLESGAVTGAEALVRWQHPVRGRLEPAQFIAIAEDCGLIIPIGRWVLREACAQARAWIDAGHPIGQMAVNVSSVEFASKPFLENLCSILDETGLEARFLELELTESVLMRNVDTTDQVLRELQTLGVGLAIDDFGTGYSSLSYLKRFPIDTLKIDQSFLRDLSIGAIDQPIVTAVIAIGRSLQQIVVAEGVETAGQLAFLQSLKCAEGQGFHFSTPLPAKDFAALFGSPLPWLEAVWRSE